LAHEKKIEVGAINITMHPHSPQKYIDLLRAASRKKLVKNIQSDKYGMITSANPLDKEKYGELGPLYGDIYRFTQIDKSADWFNTDTIDSAKDEEIKEISIPDNLKPNSSRFSYIFFPKEHIMFYEQYYDGHSFGSRSASTLIDRVLNDPYLANRFGKIDVTPIPSVDKLNKALGMKKLERLDLIIRRPNPDEQSAAEQEVLKRMNDLNIAEQEQEYKAIPNKSIKIDKELKILSNIAAKFGSVLAKGRDEEDRPIEYKTSEHPWKDKFYFDPSVELGSDMFISKVLSVKDEVLSWFKK